MEPNDDTGDADRVAQELAELRRELATLNNHRFIRIQNSWLRTLGHQFLSGLAIGLGTVVGATLLVSALVYMLAQINFIPIIGEWAARIIEVIQTR